MGQVILYNRHIEKVLDLSLHCFRDDITPVCPILCPQRPVHCRCAFHPHCALRCCCVAVAPSTPLHCCRAFDHHRPHAVHRHHQLRIVIEPSIAMAVDIPVAPSITVVALTSPWCHGHAHRCRNVAALLAAATAATAATVTAATAAVLPAAMLPPLTTHCRLAA